ncbi:MAG TPA: AAA family ATPase [Bryobacteraceae bacterium]|jgi:5-methylcytosine-specific restriction enzyme B|nr:AAA family ATPase [Bryobacteraceae bacterium]
MNISPLFDIVHATTHDSWAATNKIAFESLFGSPGGRYPKAAEKAVTLRAPEMNADTGVPFAAYIHPSNPSSGAYSGLSFVIFPIANQQCLVGLVIGTAGLTPDEAILGRPGHSRKAQAICSWLNQAYGNGKRVAWAKQDPTRNDIPVPEEVRQEWPAYKTVFDRYGGEIYALYCPTANRAATEAAVTAFLDLLFEERGYQPLTSSQNDFESIRNSWFEHLMPGVDLTRVAELLAARRYVIIQGPPGTGKTMMATDLLREKYQGRGRTIQFHPNTTYENFIGGLAPASTTGGVGFSFAPTPGSLMEVAVDACEDPSHDYLLHIDEINRADLGKILGEAIFLLEATSGSDRRINLPYDFGEPFHRIFFLPKNLHILGTMNSADRSIAIVDVAVRRRFAFVSLWPRMSVVEQFGCATMQDAFKGLVNIFIEHAADDAFPLVPGHSYFLEPEESRAKQILQVNLAPLLEEYLAQGYVSGFAEPIRAYLQKLKSL